jgi:hypothetical protein
MNNVATVLVRNVNDGGIEDRDETNTSRSRPEILPQIDALYYAPGNLSNCWPSKVVFMGFMRVEFGGLAWLICW